MKPPQTRIEKATRLAPVDAAWLLVWGCGAVLFGVAGVGAYLFAGDVQTPSAGTGLALPPPGDVRSTGSIGQGGRMEVEIYPSSGRLQEPAAMDGLQAEVDGLHNKVAELQRVIAGLQERDRQLSERLRVLEPGAPAAAGEGRMLDAVKAVPAEATQAPDTPGLAPVVVEAAPPTTAPPIETLPAPEIADMPEASPKPSQPVVAVLPPEFNRPVRIISPVDEADPDAVGSILAEDAGPVPAAPTDEPTTAASAGQTAPSDVPVERTDFAVDLGTYADSEAAAAAWATFRATRGVLTDLSPRIATREGQEGDRPAVRLLAGPFVNAADAAATCVRLAGDNIACQPTVYQGGPLPPLQDALSDLTSPVTDDRTD